MKNNLFKKSLSVFLAVLMVLSCWVWVPEVHEHSEAEAADATAIAGHINKNTLAGLTGSTTINTTSGKYFTDDSTTHVSKATEIYKNVLYSGTATAVATKSNITIRDSGALTSFSVYYPLTVLMYDGTAPQFGVSIIKDAANKCRIIHFGTEISGTDLTLANSQWYGVASGSSNGKFLDAYYAGNVNCGYTNTTTKDSNQHEGDAGEWYYMANIIKYTGTVGDNYWTSVTPSFNTHVGQRDTAVFGDNSKQIVEPIGTANTPIYVIKADTLKTAYSKIEEYKKAINDNPDIYDVASVKEFVKLANALTATNPNNYTWSSNTATQVSNYASAAKTAVTNWNNWMNGGGLKKRTYELTYENLFSLSDWANSASIEMAGGTLAYDVQAGTVTITDSTGGNTYCHSAHSGDYIHTIYLGSSESARTYTFTSKVEATGGKPNILIFDTNATLNGYDSVITDTQNPTFDFVVPAGCDRIHVRLGTANGDGAKVKYSDIALYDKARADAIGLDEWTTRPVRQVYDWNTVFNANTLVNPARTGYTFDGWYIDEACETPMSNYTNAFTFGVNDQNSYPVYSKWTENTYNIAFDANGGSGSMSAINGIKYTAEKALTNNAFTRSGYNFLGWSTDKNATSATYGNGATVSKLSATNGATVTLYAVWQINSFTVTFVNAAGETVSTQTLVYGATPEVPSNTAANHDTTNHYTYSWPTINAVTGDVTYTEKQTTTKHTMSSSVTTNATCTTDGVKTYTCSGCAYTYTETIPSTGHTEETVAGKDATCTETGLTEGKKCSVCDTVIVAQQTIAALGHLDANTDHVCDRGCGAAQGTCSDSATDNDHVCDYGCGKVLEKCSDAPNDGNHKCDICGKDNVTDHIKGEEKRENIKEATCGSAGKYDSVYYCTECNAEMERTNDVTIDQLPHTWKDATYSWSADGKTCTVSRTCANNAEHKESETVNATGAQKIAPTCTEMGTTTYTATFTATWASEQTKDVKDIPAKGHKPAAAVIENNVDATCTKDGSYETVVYCSVETCKYEISRVKTTVPAKGHTAGAEATCTTAQTCTVCNTVLVEALDHNWNETTYVWAEDGSACTATRVCKRTGCTHTETAKAEISSEVKTPATCTEMGTTTYTATFSVDWATEQTKDVVDIAALNHEWSTTYTSNGDGKDNTHYQTCTRENCGANNAAVPHTWNEGEVTTPAACLTGGVKTYTCTAAGCGATYTETVNANGHSFATTVAEVPAICTDTGMKAYKQCTVCNLYFDADAKANATDGKEDTTSFVIAIDGTNHVDQTEHNQTDATCLTVGYTAGVFCNDCKKWISGHEEIEAIRHKNKAHHAKVEPTCTVEGTIEYWSCPDCGKNFSDEACTTEVTDLKIAVNPENHNWIKGDTVAPTCTAQGYTNYKCSYCAKEKKDDFVDSTGHKEGIPVVENNVAPTCTAGGSYDEVVYCSVCNAEVSRNKVTVDALDHYWGEVTHSWSADGKSCTATRVCTRTGCNHTETATATIKSEVTTPATCTVMGTTTYTATFAESWATEQKLDVVDIAALDHAWGEVTYNFAADGSACTATRTCTRTDCNYTETATAEISSKVTTEATCTAMGTTTYTATFAETWAATQTKNVVDVAINPNNHDLKTTEAKAPTCTEIGWDAYVTCSRCDYSTYVVISATGHKYGDWTFVADGQHKRVCANDNSHVETEACADSAADRDCLCDKCNELVAHSYGNADCTKPATCTVCGATTGDALGHSFTNYVSNNDATCLADGTKTAKCDRCDETKTVKDEGSALDHSFTNYVSNNDATCLKNGTETAKCDRCDATDTREDDESALDHSFTNYVSDGNATCLANGTETAKCDRCDATDTREDDESALGHKDENKDHACDNGCEVYQGTHADSAEDADHFCDYGCGAVLEECVDEDKDHACDNGCDKAFGTCEDTDLDHDCDYGCDKYFGTHADSAEDADHVCDYGCGAVLEECVDEDKNHACDNGCDKYFGTHADSAEDTDHVCDYGCGAVLEECVDKDNDHDCDNGCDKFFGTCEDKDLDHDCDYGCDNYFGTHADNDKNHTCDYGCKVTIGTCEDKDLDHDCDYGCDKYYGTHEDTDKNHTCDYGCSVAIGEHKDSATDDNHVCDYGCGAVLEECTKSDWIIDVSATCEGKGSQYKKCTVCGKELEREEIPAIEHDYDRTKSEANLTRPVLVDGEWTKGYYTYTCKNDASHTEKEEVDRASYVAYEEALSKLNALLGADLTDAAKEAIRNAINENEVADNLIATEQEIINAATAKLGEAYTTYAGSLKTYIVTFVVDGKETKVTVISGNDAKAPENPAKAYDDTYHYVFTGWDKTFTNVISDMTVTAKFNAVKHTYTHTDKDDQYHTDTCTCGYSKDVKHSEKSAVTKKATCFADGVRTFTCTLCGGTRTETIAKREHNLVDTTVALAPTCSATGIMNQKCDCAETAEYAACDYTTTRVIPVDADAHKAEADYTVMKKATCEADGYKAILCEYCDAELSKQTIPATGHDMQKTADAVDATCTVDGKTAVYTCANGCGKTEGGEVIPATDHTYNAEVTAPTCTKGGYTTYTCACGDSYVSDNTAALGHSFGAWVGEGDCTTTVTLTRKCSRCDVTETKTESGNKHCVPVDENGKPVYDNFKDADCETGSYVYYNCTVCGSSVIEIGEALGHVLVTERVEPTCVKNGYVLDTCTRCGRVTKTVLEKLDHTWEVMPDMAPTCTADGYENCVKCFTCGTVHFDVVGKTDHADNNGDGICDMCKREYESDGCGCFCHSRNWFIRIIYAIIRFIWKVFGIHRDCVCGKVHF